MNNAILTLGSTLSKPRYAVFLMVLLTAFIVSSCSSSAPKNEEWTPERIAKKLGTPLPTHGKFNVRRTKGGSMRFDFEYIVPRDTALEAFNVLFYATDCYVTMVDSKIGLLDTIDVHLAMGTTNDTLDKDSIIVSSKGFWLNPTSREFREVTFDVVIMSKQKMYHDVYVVDLSPKTEDEASGPLMVLLPDIDEQTDSSIVFAAAAKRLRGAYSDYFPTSERLHVEILTQKGEMLFSSSVGAHFLQEVSPVEPLKKGEIIRYKYQWNGKTNSGRAVEPGKYLARISLASKPEDYTVSLPFSWRTDK